MNMTPDEMIEVIQAHKEGKQIQYFIHGNEWRDCVVGPIWDFYTYKYRVKPEPRKPREIWVNLFGGMFGAAHETFEIASSFCRKDGTTIRFREVIEEEVEA